MNEEILKLIKNWKIAKYNMDMIIEECQKESINSFELPGYSIEDIEKIILDKFEVSYLLNITDKIKEFLNSDYFKNCMQHCKIIIKVLNGKLIYSQDTLDTLIYMFDRELTEYAEDISNDIFWQIF